MKKSGFFNRIAMCTLALALAFVPAMSVQADEPLYVYLGETEAADNELVMQVGTNLDNSTDGISYRVTLGDEELEILSVSDYEAEDLQTSYVFLVDVSGSIKKSEMENIKNILTCLVNGMDEDDNASIMLIGNDVYAESFTSDKEALLEAIANIETLSEDTNLYYAINRAMDVLSTSEQVLDRKCIVILSDGQDDQISGITEKEVGDKINETNIPICSVAVRGNNEKAIEIAKVMGSFARMSPGGVHMIYGVDDVDAQAVADTVFNTTRNIAVIKADISGYEANGTENYLQVEAVVDGVGNATDGYNVKSVFISEGVVEAESEPESVEEPEVSEIVETPEEPEEDKNDGMPIWVIILIAVAVISVVAIVVVCILLSKKKKAKAAREAKEAEERAAAEARLREEAEVEEPTMESATEDEERTLPPTIEDHRPSIEVILTQIGHGAPEESLTVVVKGELTIGRKKDVADVAYEKDKNISGKHCKLVYDGKYLEVVDLDSMNGTMVNRVPIQRAYRLSNDDKIYIGATEIRVNF